MAYKKSSDTCGVYQITSPSGKKYIGSTDCFHKRKWEHFNLLEHHKHPNIILQKAFLKYKQLEFSPILICEADDLLFYEQLIIDKFKPEYNISLVAGSPMKGRKASDETKAKMSAVRKGRKHSPESIEKMRLTKIGKPLSEAHKASISNTLKNLHLAKAS